MNPDTIDRLLSLLVDSILEATPEEILQAAISSGADLDTLERKWRDIIANHLE